MAEPNVNINAGGTELRNGKTLPKPTLARRETHGDAASHSQMGAGLQQTENLAPAESERHRDTVSHSQVSAETQQTENSAPTAGSQPAVSEIDKLAQLMVQQQELFMSMMQNMQHQINQTSSARTPERIPTSSLPGKTEYHMPIQQWRIWRRDIQQYAEMAG